MRSIKQLVWSWLQLWLQPSHILLQFYLSFNLSVISMSLMSIPLQQTAKHCFSNQNILSISNESNTRSLVKTEWYNANASCQKKKQKKPWCVYLIMKTFTFTNTCLDKNVQIRTRLLHGKSMSESNQWEVFALAEFIKCTKSFNGSDACMCFTFSKKFS